MIFTIQYPILTLTAALPSFKRKHLNPIFFIEKDKRLLIFKTMVLTEFSRFSYAPKALGQMIPSLKHIFFSASGAQNCVQDNQYSPK
jgi:hypothetical protein